MELIDKIKLELALTGTEEDAYLELKIDEAYVDIDLYTNNNSINIDTSIIETVVKKLVIERYNKRGLEGLRYFSEGGTAYTAAEQGALDMLYNYRKPKLSGIRSSANAD